MKLQIARVKLAHSILLKIGTLIILRIRRKPCPKIVVEIIHRGEIDARHTERTGNHTRHIVSNQSSFAGGSVDHQVIADVRLYKEPSRSDGTGRLIRVQSAYDADSSSNNIKTAIRIMRVSIGKMGEIYTCRQFPVLVNLPVQQKAEIDVRIDLGANQHVLRIG